MKWHIGCSGFSYRDWKGVFYPADIPQRLWFDFYASKFDTLELNVTFYRFPQLKTLQNWYTKSPEHFSFSVKVPKLITHMKQMKDVQQYLTDFYTTCRAGLQEKLGPVLFQFPPKFSYTDERLQLILDALDKSFINVVEFRHNSWWCEEVYTQLKKRNIIFCGQSYPSLPDQPVVNNEGVYYRFHGVPRLYYSEYDTATLQRIADSILQNKKAKEIYIYFNNTAAIGAIDNALWIYNYVHERMKKSLKKYKRMVV